MGTTQTDGNSRSCVVLGGTDGAVKEISPIRRLHGEEGATIERGRERGKVQNEDFEREREGEREGEV